MDSERKQLSLVKDYYAILGLRPDCEPEQIKAAYRQLVLRHHPDQNPEDDGATERFLEIKEAYETLSDEEERSAYDREFVKSFPGYELEDEEEIPYWQQNPPASMPVVHDDGSDTLLRIFMVLILPLVSGGLVMNFTGDLSWTVIATIAGLVAAVWIGASLSRS